MTPLALLGLLLILSPAICGALLIRWERKGYMVTPAWLKTVDEMLLAALPVSGGSESNYVFPPLHPDLTLRGHKLPRIISEIVGDYRHIDKIALERWE